MDVACGRSGQDESYSFSVIVLCEKVEGHLTAIHDDLVFGFNE